MKYLLLTASLFLITLRLNAGIGAGCSSLGALPVELIAFTSIVTSNNIQLNWTTATEVDNYGFEIERSVLQFSNNITQCEKIGFVDGHGNSNSPKEYSFVDESVFPRLYQYRLKQIDTDGSFEYSDIIEVQFGVVPMEYALAQNNLNPFNPVTTISYSLPIKAPVHFVIYNTLGESITRLVDEEKEAGKYSVEFDATKLPSGIYFYKLQAGNFVATKKMLLLK